MTTMQMHLLPLLRQEDQEKAELFAVGGVSLEFGHFQLAAIGTSKNALKSRLF